MFIKRNRSVQKGKTYLATLLVQGKRVPLARRPGRPRADEGRGSTKVIHQTLANLSKLPDALVALIDRYCEAERAGEPLDGFVADGKLSVGPGYGELAACLAFARELGIEKALGNSRLGRLALFLVLARVIHQGSRLSSVRWAQEHAVAPLLGLEKFDEDNLYDALDWLAENQDSIEDTLAPEAKKGAVFLYDVTSSYFEGQHNELAAHGYNRDGKRYKKTVVAGLLTDEHGEPLSVQLYPGNTSDPATVEDQVNKLRTRFGGPEAVLVGDRGMVKTHGKTLLSDHGFRYVSSLTKPEIRKRLREGTIQLDLFDEKLTEVTASDGLRLILRLNPATRARARSRRADQLAKVARKVEARNTKVENSSRASGQVSLRHAQQWLQTYNLHRYIEAKLDGRSVKLHVDEERKAEVEFLDGCYVVESDVPLESASTRTLWERYGDLQKVERDFRTLKTGFLELRPIFHRKATRTRGLALVAMLALKIVRALRTRVAPLDMSAEDAIERLAGVRLVSLADPQLGLWRLPCRWPQPVQQLLDVLPKLPTPVLSLASSA